MMISPLNRKCKGEIRVYLRERKDFFDFTKFSKGIFSKDWTERGFFAVGVWLGCGGHWAARGWDWGGCA